MAKKVKKNEAKKPVISEAKPAKKRYDRHILVIGALVIVIALVLYLTLNKAPSKDVVAVVNNQEITQADVDLVEKFTPDNQRPSATEELLLNQTIDEALLLQDAENRGIAASSEEVSKTLQDAIQKSGQSQQDIEKYLAARNITEQDLNRFFKKQVIFTKLIRQTPELQVTVTEEEMKAFYQQNRAQIPAPYEAAKEQIRKFVENNKLTQAFAAYLGKLRSESDIRIVKQ